MRYFPTVILSATLGLLAAGCENRSTYNGPKVDSFTGRVVKEGKPVSFPPGESVQLKLIHDQAKSFGIPLDPDGAFKIGWMPIGKYSAILIRQKDGAKGGPNMYNVRGGFEIVEGKTEYVVELGREWKP